MKKTLALIFAAMFVLMLFAGCGGTNTTTPTKAPDSGTTTPTKAPDTGKATPAPTAAPTEEPSPYHFAKGKYAVDAEGWPLEKYEYELPLSTTDEKFTNMTLSFTPQYIPEAGMGSMPMYKGMEDMTGVHIEYNVVASAQYSERLGVMEASQDLCDITAGFWAYHQGGSLTQCIDDEVIINHYDYREYAPNFCKWAKDWQHIEGMWGRVNMPTTDKWIAFVDFYDQPCQTTGYFMRGDWLDKLGLDAYSAITFDDWYDQLMAIKVAGFENCEYPLQVYSSIDAYANVWNDFNTTPYASGCTYNRVIDGKVSFNGTTEDDLVLAKYIRKWFEDGIIIPYFQSLSGLDDITSDVTNGNVGCCFMNPSEVAGTEASCVTPGARFDAMKKLVRKPGNIIHWNLDPDEFGGTGSSVSAACENIELVVTWLDWCYSPTGADWRNFGPEGEYWSYNDKGEREWNEKITGFEMGAGWATMAYLQNPMDSGVNAQTRNYLYPGGERLLHFFEVWNECLDYYDGIYNYPAAIKLSDEDSNEVASLRTDCNTFFSENYVQFLVGDKDFSEWDSFQKQLMDGWMSRITEIYQDAYDDYKKG